MEKTKVFKVKIRRIMYSETVELYVEAYNDVEAMDVIETIDTDDDDLNERALITIKNNLSSIMGNEIETIEMDEVPRNEAIDKICNHQDVHMLFHEKVNKGIAE